MALVCDVYCDFVTFPSGNLGQVWYLIVSIPDLCCLSYFVLFCLRREQINKLELVWYERWESPYGLVVLYSQGCISNPGLSFNTDYPLKKGNFAYNEVSNDGVLVVYH